MTEDKQREWIIIGAINAIQSEAFLRTGQGFQEVDWIDVFSDIIDMAEKGRSVAQEAASVEAQ